MTLMRAAVWYVAAVLAFSAMTANALEVCGCRFVSSCVLSVSVRAFFSCRTVSLPCSEMSGRSVAGAFAIAVAAASFSLTRMRS